MAQHSHSHLLSEHCSPVAHRRLQAEERMRLPPEAHSLSGVDTRSRDGSGL